MTATEASSNTPPSKTPSETATLLHAGQRDDELFDVYEAPAERPKSSSAFYVPTKAGVTKTRREVHQTGAWHLSVIVWVASPDGQLLIQQRSAAKDTFPLCWDVSVAGHVGAGEDAFETAVREVEEEIGLRVTPSDLRPLFTNVYEARGETARHGRFVCREFQLVFMVVLPSVDPHAPDTPFHIDAVADEVSALEALPYDKVLESLWATVSESEAAAGKAGEGSEFDAAAATKDHDLGMRSPDDASPIRKFVTQSRSYVERLSAIFDATFTAAHQPSD